MPNTMPFPNLDAVKDPATKDALRKLWEALYNAKQQTASAFAIASPSTEAQTNSLLGLS